VQFSDSEIVAIRRAALALWDACAYDLLAGVAEEERRSIYSVTIPRAHAIEIALDAGRAENWLKRAGASADLLNRVRAASHEELIELVTPAFPHSWIGL